MITKQKLSQCQHTTTPQIQDIGLPYSVKLYTGLICVYYIKIFERKKHLEANNVYMDKTGYIIQLKT